MILEGWQKIDRGARHAAPALTTLLIMLISMVPLRLQDFGTITPVVALMGIFYWSVYRPDLMGPITATLLGFMQDVLSGAPLGLNAFVCLIVQSSVASQRQLFQAHGFFILWWGYMLTVILAGFTCWALFAILHFDLVPFQPVLFQAGVSIALFPPFAWLMGRVHHAFLSGG